MTGMNDGHQYDDIINLPHPVSKRHPQMPLLDRAAQFSPFAALTGHDAAVRETARLTQERQELDEDSKAVIDERLKLLMAHCKEQPEVMITYFEPDERKSGGAYVTTAGKVRKMDSYGRKIFLEKDIVVRMDEIIAIEGALFSGMDDLNV